MRHLEQLAGEQLDPGEVRQICRSVLRDPEAARALLEALRQPPGLP